MNAPLFPRGQTLVLNRLALSPSVAVLALAPHPDDFDAVGVSLRRLRENGNAIAVVVLTDGASGVEDGFRAARTPEEKGRIREAEQRASSAFFGLPKPCLHFARLRQDAQGQLLDDETNRRHVAEVLAAHRPGLVFLPHGNDTNLTHQRVHRMFLRALPVLPFRPEALLACDPKTIAMTPTVFTVFDEATAQWKRQLLRFHDSQQQRNLHTRGHGFDDRILAVNRRIAAERPELGAPYAEAFEVG